MVWIFVLKFLCIFLHNFFIFWFNLFNFLIFFKEHQRHHDLFSYKNDVGFGGITARILLYFLSIMRNAFGVATSYPHKLVVFFSIWINNINFWWSCDKNIYFFCELSKGAGCKTTLMNYEWWWVIHDVDVMFKSRNQSTNPIISWAQLIRST